MDTAALTASPFLPLIGWSVLLLIAHILLQAQLATAELGLDWNAGPRDGDKKIAGSLAGRAERASANFRETYAAFVAVALASAIAGDTGWALTAGWVWFAARIVYIPLYLLGVPYVRSMVWLVSLLAIVVMAFGLIL